MNPTQKQFPIKTLLAFLAAALIGAGCASSHHDPFNGETTGRNPDLVKSSSGDSRLMLKDLSIDLTLTNNASIAKSFSENFHRIHPGMSFNEVSQLMGLGEAMSQLIGPEDLAGDPTVLDNFTLTIGDRTMIFRKLVLKSIQQTVKPDSIATAGLPAIPASIGTTAHIFLNPVVRISSVVTHPRNGQTGRVFGSGFIVTTNGYILSNEHVVHYSADGEEWSVSSLSVSIDPDTPMERTFNADVVASDARADIAVLKINCPDSLPRLPLASGTNAAMGDPVLVHGYPLGGRFKIVDAKILRLQEPDQKFSVNVLVCVGKVEHGNSGGAVLNASGNVVGVTVAKAQMSVERIEATKTIQQIMADAIKQAAEERSKKLKEQGNTAQAQQIDELGKKLLTTGEFSPHGYSILDEAERNPNLTYAIAIKDVRQLLERWKVPLFSGP